ncbi:MAG: bifunctional (p)ppGpp synthetase/guanosine-3',5'-bis(diphosphate) 3'-pyrophosphohydrolase [Lachnospiraceae bacterium]|nr:bifunctional (p)ppGpp synthetase/guanosine-3',5'-bis(diphosphate) 3'-pyrophosphohydrolase [Lachnospiraceae bacterium]
MEQIETDEKVIEFEEEIEEQLGSIHKTEDFQDPEDLYQELLACIKQYHPSDDLSVVEKAYRMAKEMHKDQRRKSGEPYIIHPICVAIILADLEMDKETIVAGLLHDVVEDTAMTKEEVAKEFGDEVALLVDGVTKLTRLNYDQDKLEVQAESLRKMFLAMAKDIRVIIIKLADRLHNMRTLKYMKPEKQKEKARETMDIYAPLAQRLGISKIKIELDDLALKYLKPDVYFDLVEKVQMNRTSREEFIAELEKEVRGYIDEAEIKADISGRVKHFFSIYKKMVNQDKTIDQVYDLFAIRIIVDSVKDCYAALGVIHEKYKPIPGRFKDYIAMPKPNRYQSLHTTLISNKGKPFEIQIRTYEMHRVAEYGIAAHWKYKESSNGGNPDMQEEEKLAWLRQILEWQKDMSDNKEFMSLLKSDLDLFSDTVFCFTPSGDVKNLPKGSTPIDFAYYIHSAVGNRMVGAKVNGKLVPIDYKVKNGDRIEIITSQNTKGPSRDWLGIVKSSQAKSKINAWFKAELKEENIVRGKDLVDSYAKSHGHNTLELFKPEIKEEVCKKYGFKNWDALMASVGHGGMREGQVVNKMADALRKQKEANITDDDIMENIANRDGAVVHHKKSKSGITVKGVHDVAVRFSKCCSPVPGDEIVGYITRGRGVTIHRTDCINMIHLSDMEKSRLIEAEWQDATADGGSYTAEITVYGNNRRGLLVDITRIFTEQNIDIQTVHTKTGKNGIATMELGFPIKNKEQLTYLVGKIRQVESIIDIERTKG